MAKHNVKLQVWDLVRVVGIVTPFATRGVAIREKSFYQAPGGKWAQETYIGCPKQRYATEEPGKVQVRARVGIVEESCGYRSRGISMWGNFDLSRNLGYKTRGVA